MRKEATSGKLQAARSFDTNKTQYPLYRTLCKSVVFHQRFSQVFKNNGVFLWTSVSSVAINRQKNIATEDTEEH